MDNYKYFENAKKNGFFTEIPCQFCGSYEFCLDGVFFQRSDDLSSICLDCLDKHRSSVDIPKYVADNVEDNRNKIVTELSFCPPVPWIQNNDWPVCCDDFMVYAGEWKQENFIDNAADGDGLSLLKELLIDELKNNVENYKVLWDDLNYETAAFVFKCPICGKTVVVCQDY